MQQKINTADSLGFFNLARGLGMVLILWGHSANVYTPYAVGAWSFSRNVFNLLGSGIMAMFFLISGYSFYKRSPKKCFFIQKKNLLHPYWITAAMVILTKLLLALVEQRSFWEHGGEYILTYLFGLNAEGGGFLLGFPIESVSIFWFVLALFGGWVIYNAIVHLKDQRIQCLLVFCCVTAGWLLTLISKVWPFCLPIALLTVGYLAAGAWIRRKNLLYRKIPAWAYLLMAILLGVCAAFGEVNIVRCIWRLGLVDIGGSFCCGFLLLRLYARIMKRNPHSLPILLLESVGFHSLSVVCLHAYEKVIFPWYRLAGLFPQSPWLCTIICFICRSICIYLLYQVVSRCGLLIKKHRRKRTKIVID